jgi:hypothetical protein
MSFMDMQQWYGHLGIGRKCTWTIISSTGLFDCVMKERDLLWIKQA